MLSKTLFWGTVLCGLAVIFGAFGAHALQPILSAIEVAPGKTPPLQVFKTGVEYQFYHGLALILTAILYKQKPTGMVKNAGIFFILGILLFSGSLYALTLGHVLNKSMAFVGPITPLGGVCFIIGWALLAFSFAKKDASVTVR